MRKAKISDMFKLARFCKKIGIKDDLFNAQKDIDDVERIGFNVIVSILDKVIEESSENELYEVLSGPFEIPAKEIKELDFENFVKMVKEVFNFSALLNFLMRVD